MPAGDLAFRWSAACREVGDDGGAAQQVVLLDGAEITRRVEALLPEIAGRADEIAAARRLPRASSMH